MSGNQVNESLPPKVPSKWLLLVIAVFIVIGPFTTPNGLWFCWCCSGSLIYIYINLNLRYNRWLKEQESNKGSSEEKKKRESKKQK